MLNREGFCIYVKLKSSQFRFYRDVLELEIKEDENSSNVYQITEKVVLVGFNEEVWTEKMKNEGCIEHQKTSEYLNPRQSRIL